MRIRKLTAACMAATGAIALAACSVGPSEADAERYRAELAAVPGIIDSEMLSVQPQGIPAPPVGSVRITVPADPAVIDAVIDTACATADAKRTKLVITITDGTAALHRVDEGCPSNTLNLAAIFEDMRAAKPNAYVWLGADTNSDAILVSDFTTGPYDDEPDYETARAWLPTLAAVYRHAGSTPLEVSARDVSISQAPASEHLDTIEALTDLAAGRALQKFWLISDSLVVRVPDSARAEAISTIIGTDNAFAGLDIEVIALPLDSPFGVVTAPMARLAETAFSLGAEDVYVRKDGALDLEAPSVETITTWSESLAALNAEGVRVALRASDGNRAFAVLEDDPALAITTTKNPYPQWVEWYQQIAEVSPEGRSIRGAIRFGADRIEVFRPNETEIPAITAVVDKIARDNGLSSYSVNAVEHQLE